MTNNQATDLSISYSIYSKVYLKSKYVNIRLADKILRKSERRWTMHISILPIEPNSVKKIIKKYIYATPGVEDWFKFFEW